MTSYGVASDGGTKAPLRSSRGGVFTALAVCVAASVALLAASTQRWAYLKLPAGAGVISYGAKPWCGVCLYYRR